MSELLPISLSSDEIDELIYDARSNDLVALRNETETLSKRYNCSASSVIVSAIDLEDESEGGTGGCLLHWPAANGYLGMSVHRSRSPKEDESNRQRAK
jgi:uncharacterized protein